MRTCELDDIEREAPMPKVATNPEAIIEQMIHELAYERVKHSYLFNVLENVMADRKADQLATKIAVMVESWILEEVSQASEYHAPSEGESHPAFECEKRGCPKPVEVGGPIGDPHAGQ